MKKIYNSVKAEVVLFDADDVIRTSGTNVNYKEQDWGTFDDSVDGD